MKRRKRKLNLQKFSKALKTRNQRAQGAARCVNMQEGERGKCGILGLKPRRNI